jgi:uncharacterized repeat protein (TIGR03803 family)
LKETIVRTMLLIAVAVLLAGCSAIASLPAQSFSDNQRNGVASSASVGLHWLYSFTGKPDGSDPSGTLISLDGTLYGTTQAGGANNLGSIFSVSTSGEESVIYSFGGPSTTDGKTPMAGLINVDGTFYGTTTYGGANCAPAGCGTVFEVSPSGTESVIYSFQGGTDGSHPVGGLIDVGGTLYGTTSQGGHGRACCGTVFAIAPSGSESVLYRFQGTKKDGFEPLDALIDVKGELYGTTRYGGAAGHGTIFTVNLSGKERVLYAFKGSPNDGAEPFAGLTMAGGKLFGTTVYGGKTTECALGCGTVFVATPSGSEKVLYAFEGGSDGFAPVANVVARKGELYGATMDGGYLRCNGGVGCGTIFQVTGNGKKSLLYTFRGGKKYGAVPAAGFTGLNGALYGTTFGGGSGHNGTVFKFTP